ncbi:hypothetical protein V4F39_04240 [Aquincola sp. MAHUQ-54]|uniref:Uncharacterized protein n=1 Tax=Aquincola agrisoli TaxID=3119538 RepID=A0AAW9Q7C7_9BURK
MDDPDMPADWPKGLIVLPGSERRVWWTGRVAIGLLYGMQRQEAPPGGPQAGRAGTLS